MAGRLKHFSPLISLEFAFDRVAHPKLQQAYEVLVPDRVHVIAEPPNKEGANGVGVGVATTNDFAAESSRPGSLLSTLRPLVAPPGARLASGLPAAALTGLDFHQLDSFEGFHQLISDPPFPRFSQRDSPDFHGTKLI
jgi:hypothetical protein